MADSEAKSESPASSGVENPPAKFDSAHGVDDEKDAAKSTGSVLKAESHDQPGENLFATLFGGVSELSSQAVKFAARKTRDTTFRVFKNTPEQLELLGKAGRSLRDLREVAGVSLDDVSKAIDLHDPDLLRSVEEGKAALPFEVLLRLSSFYARNDPVPFVMKYARVYSPRVWKMLQAVGVDRIMLQAERELQFLQIYRSRDAARKLSDEGFNEVLAFTRKAFEMSLHFASEQEQKVSEAKRAADEAMSGSKGDAAAAAETTGKRAQEQRRTGTEE